MHQGFNSTYFGITQNWHYQSFILSLQRHFKITIITFKNVREKKFKPRIIDLCVKALLT